MLYVCVMCMFCKSPEVTLCGWRDFKPSISKQLCFCKRIGFTLAYKSQALYLFLLLLLLTLLLLILLLLLLLLLMYYY